MHLSLQSLSPLLFLLYLDLRYRENDLIILPDLSYVVIPDPSRPPSLHVFVHSLIPLEFFSRLLFLSSLTLF